MTYHPNGAVAEEIWFHNGIAHRDNGPAILRYHQNGQCEEEIWMHKGKCHRFEGPAIQCFYEDGTLFQEEWMRKDLHARPSGPVLVAYYPCGNVEVEMYVLNAEAEESLNILYRRDGSIERRVWKKSNEIHRENGEPAIIYYDENGRILDGEWLRNGAPDTRTPAHKMVLWKKWFKYLKREVA